MSLDVQMGSISDLVVDTQYSGTIRRFDTHSGIGFAIPTKSRQLSIHRAHSSPFELPFLGANAS